MKFLIALLLSLPAQADFHFTFGVSWEQNIQAVDGSEASAVSKHTITIPLNGGYGEYFEQSEFDEITVYRTLVVTKDQNECRLTATILWNNGNSATSAFTCAELEAAQSKTLSISGDVNGKTFTTTYTLHHQ